MPPKKDPKYQTRGEFLQQKGAFLDHKKRHKIDVFQVGGCGAGRPGGWTLNFVPLPIWKQHAARVIKPVLRGVWREWWWGEDGCDTPEGTLQTAFLPTILSLMESGQKWVYQK